jgi:HEPN domain-containing protein
MADMHLVRQWWSIADSDLRAAQYDANNMWPTPFEIICFHCQQAAEKYLKGFLVFHDKTPPRIHDLDELCKQCKSIEPLFAQVADICSRLTQYGVQPRYPSEMSLDKDDMLRALHDA